MVRITPILDRTPTLTVFNDALIVVQYIARHAKSRSKDVIDWVAAMVSRAQRPGVDEVCDYHMLRRLKQPRFMPEMTVSNTKPDLAFAFTDMFDFGAGPMLLTVSLDVREGDNDQLPYYEVLIMGSLSDASMVKDRPALMASINKILEEGLLLTGAKDDSSEPEAADEKAADEDKVAEAHIAAGEPATA